MKNIKKDLEQKDIKRAYLIFGEERFLVRSAKNMLLRGLVTLGSQRIKFSLIIIVEMSFL